MTQVIFEQVNGHLADRGMLMREGMIVDATIIAAQPSTKNKAKARDPEMHQTRKGNEWYFGMKCGLLIKSVTNIIELVTSGFAANLKS
ncbi:MULTISPECIES: hypothetical protein [unclassified Marinobacter]|uniref:hypothetical protein n=1 Tax=unclassified Marinobacter TaxID=83889 RepID=UPI00200EBBA5|nr:MULTISPECIES: hypothetical protein [unclassified Marinobacter]UQG55348.1 hypothetical protein MIH16_18420 [Marinobacter sp. M4C]UQG64151.1 hypothetical protein MIH17_18405 [Marinobacter sp. M2C]UQG68434.1 hypothetical protein MIH19_18425 [Marinobacter sp. M1C]